MIVYQQPIRHAFTPRKVVVWSGLSDPRTCALSQVQWDFLAAVQVPEAWKIYRNFPYVPTDLRREETPLVKASWHNLKQFLLASRRPYCQAVRRHWQALRDSTREIIVIALSCGLEIMNNCMVAQRDPRIRVIALGPVSWQTPRVPHLLIQGEYDYLSKLFFRKVDVVLPGAGHMAYFQHPQVLNLVNESICGKTST